MFTYRPSSSESAPFYHKYIQLLGDRPLLELLQNGQQQTEGLLSSGSDATWKHRYAAEKWSLAESFLHMIDTERIMSYRALRIARGDKTPLPGFDQDTYAPLSGAAERSGRSLLEEYATVRASSVSLFAGLKPESLLHMGEASGHPVSVRALGYIIAGHELHHLKLFRGKYGM
jgi:hypothetical protein